MSATRARQGNLSSSTNPPQIPNVLGTPAVPSNAPLPASTTSRPSKPAVSLVKITDAEDTNISYQVLSRMRTPALTLTVVRAPSDSRVGWIKCWNGALNESLQPSSLSEKHKQLWPERIWRGLSAHEENMALSIKDVAADRALDECKRRSELRLSYKGSTLIRVVLTPPEVKHGDSLRAYREQASNFMKQVTDLVEASVLKVNENTARAQKSSEDLAARLKSLQEVAIKKTYQEEAIYAWSQRILAAKDTELKRIAEERVKLETELKVQQMKKDLGQQDGSEDAYGSQSNSLGLRIPGSQITEEELLAMAKPVDDDERDSGDSDGGRNSDGEIDDEGRKSKKRSPASSAAPAAKKPRAAPAKKKAPAAPKPKAAPKEKKLRAPAKPRAKAKRNQRKEEESDEDGDDDEDKPAPAVPAPSRPKRSRKRVRSPSPISEEDEQFDDGDRAYDPHAMSDADSAAAAVAQVDAFEAGADVDDLPDLPLPSRRGRPQSSRSAASSSSVRPPTPHAVPSSIEDSVPSSVPSVQHATAADDQDDHDARQRKKRRAISPPPRVLPKKSLAEILRDGVGSEMDESPSQIVASTSALATTATRRASQRAHGPDDMEMSSQ